MNPTITTPNHLPGDAAQRPPHHADERDSETRSRQLPLSKVRFALTLGMVIGTASVILVVTIA